MWSGESSTRDWIFLQFWLTRTVCLGQHPSHLCMIWYHYWAGHHPHALFRMKNGVLIDQPSVDERRACSHVERTPSKFPSKAVWSTWVISNALSGLRLLALLTQTSKWEGNLSDQQKPILLFSLAFFVVLLGMLGITLWIVKIQRKCASWNIFSALSSSSLPVWQIHLVVGMLVLVIWNIPPNIGKTLRSLNKILAMKIFPSIAARKMTPKLVNSMRP